MNEKWSVRQSVGRRGQHPTCEWRHAVRELLRRFAPRHNGALALLLLAAAARAGYCDDAIRHFPGFMWLQARDRSDLIDERENSIVEGAIEQGIDWPMTDDLRLNSFARLEAKRDEQALDWNRKYLLSVGGKLRYLGIPRTLVAIGARYDVDRRSESNESRTGFTGFVSWGSYWDVVRLSGREPASVGVVGAPGTTWGELRYPSSHFGDETSTGIIEGAIEQGIDWTRVLGSAVLNTFARIEYTLDSEGLDWNNKLRFGPGAKIKIDVGSQGLLELGVQYQWHHRLISDRTRSSALLFLNWNLSWDFGEFAQKSN